MARNSIPAAVIALCFAIVACADDATNSARTPWTTSRITGSPEPPHPYVAERVFPGLSFTNPVEMALEPGTGRLWMLELGGKLFAFPNEPGTREPHLVLDSHAALDGHEQSYGFTFHPDYERNRTVFLCYVLKSPHPEGTRVSRFRVKDSDPPEIDAASEEIVITWFAGGHNGGCLQFGPDGYLYISSGDGVGPFPPDPLGAGQDMTQLLSKILRIDVDRPDADRGTQYTVPADNPFVDLAGARPETWAYGFRNPWKMSFDPRTGELWCGDVGWDMWELLYRVEKGGNYGWSIMEGRQPIRSDLKPGPTPILSPTVEHPHTEAESITGGYVYLGDRLPELHGAYVYGDWETGKMWALRNDGNKVTWHQEIADVPLQIICFGLDAANELYVVDYLSGGIYRLVPNPRRDQNSDFPRKLSETGLFASVHEHKPAPGVYRYNVIAQPWMDGATAERLIALPGDTTIHTKPNREQWVYPENAVFAKTVSLPLEVGNPSSARRLETQLIHFDGQDWQFYTYAWNDEQTDAELVPTAGLERAFTIRDPAADGGTRQQTWRFHSRSECASCHTTAGGRTLGIDWEQFVLHDAARSAPDARSVRGAGGELLAGRDFVDLALLDALNPPRRDVRPLVDPYDASADLDARARAWLDVNCSTCHRRNGGGAAFIAFPYADPLENTGALDAPPTQGTFALPQARIIAPGDPFRSVLMYRVATVGRGHMPQLGARTFDAQGADLLFRWIEQMDPDDAGKSDGLETRPTDAALARIRADEESTFASLQRNPNGGSQDHATALDRLLSTTTGALRVVRAIDCNELPSPVQATAIARGTVHADPVIRGLFERFLPEERRPRRLGTSVNADAILALSGDAARGRTLFLDAQGVTCRNCHRVGERGRAVGPDLSKIGGKLDRRQLLESILDPSRRIDPQYVTTIVETQAGRVITGVVTERTAEGLTLRDAQGQDITLTPGEIELTAVQPKSLMPDLLVQELTPQELADLLEFLCALKE